MVTDPLRSAIRELEERLMQTHVRNTRAFGAPLFADDFVEFGTSGRSYDKEAVLSALAADTSAPVTANVMPVPNRREMMQ
ncbi:MAG TPA: nuclear transport factor 2 family protein [Casimicrobiaceae bacterium]|nr:nuclear transport factor 2 family protein [Casimicrobiaceae bacterium]